MTLEEALLLPAGKILDAVVAWKVFGWPRSTVLEARAGIYDPMTFVQSPPEYSTEIAAAWQVVEKLRPPFWVSIDDLRKHSAGGYSCAIGLPENNASAWAEADTACLVICRAALKAVWRDLP